MTYYTYTISYCHEYDYARYMKGSESVYSETEIPEDEWKHMISNAFQEVFDREGDIELSKVIEYLIKNDERLLGENDLFIPIGNSEFWEPYWDNWDVSEYDPETMKMYKREDEDMDEAIFLIPSKKEYYESFR